MARSRKRTMLQRMARSATSGLPTPIRHVVCSRPGTLLGLLVLALLFMGILSVGWNNGKPSVSIDEERAGEVKRQVAETVDSMRDRFRSEWVSERSFRAPDGSFNPFWSESESLLPQQQRGPSRVEMMPLFSSGPASESAEQAQGRLSQLRENLPRWR